MHQGMELSQQRRRGGRLKLYVIVGERRVEVCTRLLGGTVAL